MVLICNLVKVGVFIIFFISTISYAGHQYLLDQSPVFSDDALEVNICFGDVNNDGVIDMVIGKHQDHKIGRTAAFQQTQTGWDAGTEIYQGGNGNVNPFVGYINGSNRLVVNNMTRAIMVETCSFLNLIPIS